LQEQRTNLVNDQEEKQETLDHLIEDKNYLFNVLIPKSTELDNLYTQLENLNNQLTTVSTAFAPLLAACLAIAVFKK